MFVLELIIFYNCLIDLNSLSNGVTASNPEVGQMKKNKNGSVILPGNGMLHLAVFLDTHLILITGHTYWRDRFSAQQPMIGQICLSRQIKVRCRMWTITKSQPVKSVHLKNYYWWGLNLNLTSDPFLHTNYSVILFAAQHIKY